MSFDFDDYEFSYMTASKISIQELRFHLPILCQDKLSLAAANPGSNTRNYTLVRGCHYIPRDICTMNTCDTFYQIVTEKSLHDVDILIVGRLVDRFRTCVV